MIRVLLAAIGALIAMLFVQSVNSARARAAAVRSSQSLDSAEAARDTTREIELGALRDSVRVFVRRSVQQEQRADALDKDLGAQRMARLNAHVRIAALDTVIRAGTPIDTIYVTRNDGRSNARLSRFSVRQEPYTVVGEIAGGMTADVDSVSLHVDMDSIPLQVRLSCSQPTENPVRRALVVAVTPRWARLTLGDVEQSLDVCNPELERQTARTGVVGVLRRFGVSAGAGIIAKNGQAEARPALIVGFRLWP
jgi:hypothetical protein